MRATSSSLTAEHATMHFHSFVGSIDEIHCRTSKTVSVVAAKCRTIQLHGMALLDLYRGLSPTQRNGGVSLFRSGD